MLIKCNMTKVVRGSVDFRRAATAIAKVAVILFGGLANQDLSAEDAPKSDSAAASKVPALEYHCSVVDKETGRGIPNARVIVRRSALNSEGNRIIEESKHITDADGRYDVKIPSDQVAISSLYIELDVEHDDYTAKKGHGYALGMIRKNETLGERPFFEKTELYPGEAVTGTIVSPDGEPLAGIKVQVFSRAKRMDTQSSSFNDTLTDEQGHFRINLHKNADGALWVIPKDFASIEKFLAQKRGDLGTIKLAAGVRVSGQIKNADGQPLTGIPIRIEYAGRREVVGMAVATSVRRGAVSDAEGRFEFGPLAPGQYIVTPTESLADPLKRDRTIYEIPGVFLRQRFEIKEGIQAQSVMVQAVPHVLFSGQIFDSQGNRRGGHAFHLSGRVDGVGWFASGRPDKNGTFAVRVPHGLQNTEIQISSNEHQSLRYRRGPDQPIENRKTNWIDFGTLNDDVEGFEIIYYKAPVVLVSAVDEDKNPISGFRVSARYPWGEQRYGQKGEMRSDLHFEHQADSRYRTSQMLPDEDVTFTLTAPGYESASKAIKLTEGETQELVLTLNKGTSESPKAEVENK